MRARVSLTGLVVLVGFAALVPSVFAQTCDSSTRIHLYPAALEELRSATAKQRLRVRVGGNTFLAEWRDQLLFVDLQGDQISPAQLNSLELTLPGFRFPLIPGSIRSRVIDGTCVGHYSFDVNRVWQVAVNLPNVAEKILVEVEAMTSPSSTTRLEVPGVLPASAAPWAALLRLTVYPVPGDRERQKYNYDLRATDLANSKCRGHAEPGILCQDRDEIQQLLLKNKSRGASWALGDLIQRKTVVPRIEFQLQTP